MSTASALAAATLWVPSVAHSEGQDFVSTILFQRENVPYLVASYPEPTGQLCTVAMGHRETKYSVLIGMNGSGRIMINVKDPTEASPLRTAASGSAVQFTVEVDGTKQVYNLSVRSAEEAGAVVTAAAQSHLQKAISSRAGLSTTLSGSSPVSFTVPPEAAARFDECVRASITDRARQAVEQLQRQQAR